MDTLPTGIYLIGEVEKKRCTYAFIYRRNIKFARAVSLLRHFTKKRLNFMLLRQDRNSKVFCCIYFGFSIESGMGKGHELKPGSLVINNAGYRPAVFPASESKESLC